MLIYIKYSYVLANRMKLIYSYSWMDIQKTIKFSWRRDIWSQGCVSAMWNCWVVYYTSVIRWIACAMFLFHKQISMEHLTIQCMKRTVQYYKPLSDYLLGRWQLAPAAFHLMSLYGSGTVCFSLLASTGMHWLMEQRHPTAMATVSRDKSTIQPVWFHQCSSAAAAAVYRSLIYIFVSNQFKLGKNSQYSLCYKVHGR